MSNNYHELYRELHAFVVVTECGSFSAAADLLGTSPASISRAIQKLEQALGLRLLNRTTRKVGVTSEGCALYTECQAGLRQIRSALDATQDSRTMPRGLLRITAPITFGRRFITPLVTSFRKMYRDIEIDLSLSDEPFDLVDSGFDIAIYGGHPGDSRTISKPLAPIPMYVCASPKLLADHGTPASPDELLKFPCVLFRFRGTGKMLQWEFQANRRKLRLEVTGGLCVDDIESACHAAIAGEGLAQLPGYIAIEHIRNGALVPVLLDCVDTSRRFSISYVNRSGRQPLRSSLFIRYVTESLRSNKSFQLMPAEIKELRGHR